jgi:hypothetical protein
MTRRLMTITLDRALWFSFWLLFVMMILAAWLPVEPIVWGFPFWALVTLALIVASVVIAAVAGIYYEWPTQRATRGKSR